MQLVFSTKYIYIYYIPKKEILYSEWTEQASKMPSEEFQKHVLEIVAKGDEYAVKGYVTNSRKGHFMMSTSIQEWHEEVIVPLLLNQSFKKLGFVLPQSEEDYAATVLLELTFTEEKAQAINTRFFDSVEKAMAWVST